MAFPLKVWEVVMMGRYPHFVSEPTAVDEQACHEAMQFFDVAIGKITFYEKFVF